MQERLQKFLNRSGVASRRKAEELISAGQVLVNGKKVKLGAKVDPAIDVVKVSGKVVQNTEEFVYIAFNKPLGSVSSRQGQSGKKTVYDFLPKNLKDKVWTVGRLDFNTEGLLLFTNDGELTQKLTHPSLGHEKEYEVMLHKNPTELQLSKLRMGVDLGDYKTQPCKVTSENAKVWITLQEGKYRQVRRMFSVLGLEILELKRVRMGNYELPKDLNPGEHKFITKAQIG
jgi:23S rRNA pseudouridine2605 synthase